MKKSQAEPTTGKNLEDKFERGEEVLDYFDVPKARVIRPQLIRSSTEAKSSGSCSVKRNSARSPVVRARRLR